MFAETDTKRCLALTQIIKDYEEASGQLINKDKPSITFSRKTGASIKNRVKQQLGITKEGGTGKYLGLPELFGRKRRISLLLLLIVSNTELPAGRRSD